MDSNADHAPKIPGDLRISVYRIVKFFVLLIAGAFAVKYALIDTLKINTDQMAPALLAGDRICIFRTPFVLPFRKIGLPGRGTPVVAGHPLFGEHPICLRVAGLPGDSMMISRGKFLIVDGSPAFSLGSALADDEVLPLEFAPRDTMTPYRLPKRADAIELDSLTMRDFFYACAMIRQENPQATCTVLANLFIDTILSNEYTIKEFPLYKGALSAIPKKYEYDWFFWDRLKEYLTRSLSGKDVNLSFGLLMNGSRVSRYSVKEQFVFLLADDWRKGFDSRYFGPVRAQALRGRILFVVWSIRPKGGAGSFLRMDRLIKVVK
jgi:hypothetical protein